jgi:sugar O-acyltransferase, sialic acid O-acetyltransferase NeuD family
MSRLAILGAGGHGRVVADAATARGAWSSIEFFDDQWPGKSKSGPWPVVGNTEGCLARCTDYDGVVIALGNNPIRLELSRKIEALGGRLATVIHPSAVVSSHAQVGQGVVIFAGAVVNIGAVIGDAVIINTAATVDHDCAVEDAVHLSPGVHLAGEVRVSKGAWLGVGACVRNRITIGAGSVVGAGAVVVRDVDPGATVVGNPARPLRSY